MEWLIGHLQTWEWLGILLARLAVGTLFVLSGGGKLFSGNKRQSMRETMTEAGIPWPGFNTVFVATVELVCGTLLVLGLFTPIACVLLAIVMVTALATVQVRKMESRSVTAWLSEFLYLPEAMYLVILLWLLVSGPGRVSVDAVWFG